MNDQRGPIAHASWTHVPCVSGRVATEADVENGSAVFYIEDSADGQVIPIPITLPSCAIWRDEDGSERPVILIQAEQFGSTSALGVRFLEGGDMVCTLPEVQILEGPDDRFVFAT